jgi:predicted amidohydrolase YtcJ
VAVHRTPPPGYPDGVGTTEPFLPAERLDLGTAVATYTLGSAYVHHLDAISGSISVGKEADLVVLDRDLFGGPPEEIGGARVLLTMVAGERVHAAGDLA